MSIHPYYLDLSPIDNKRDEYAWFYKKSPLLIAGQEEGGSEENIDGPEFMLRCQIKNLKKQAVKQVGETVEKAKLGFEAHIQELRNTINFHVENNRRQLWEIGVLKKANSYMNTLNEAKSKEVAKIQGEIGNLKKELRCAKLKIEILRSKRREDEIIIAELKLRLKAQSKEAVSATADEGENLRNYVRGFKGACEERMRILEACLDQEFKTKLQEELDKQKAEITSEFESRIAKMETVYKEYKSGQLRSLSSGLKSISKSRISLGATRRKYKAGSHQVSALKLEINALAGVAMTMKQRIVHMERKYSHFIWQGEKHLALLESAKQALGNDCARLLNESKMIVARIGRYKTVVKCIESKLKSKRHNVPNVKKKKCEKTPRIPALKSFEYEVSRFQGPKVEREMKSGGQESLSGRLCNVAKGPRKHVRFQELHLKYRYI